MKRLPNIWPLILLYAVMVFMIGAALADPTPERIVVVMPDGTTQSYERVRPTTGPTTLPATMPATAPATLPATPPPSHPTTQPLPPPGVLVKPGQSWVAAVRSAKAGDTIRLARGGVWTEALTDTSLRLPAGVTIAADDGDPADPGGAANGDRPLIQVAAGPAAIFYRAKDLTLRGIEFASSRPTAAGLQFWGCEGIRIDACDVSGFRIGVTCEAFAGKRSSRLEILDSVLHDNWHAANGHAHGLFADKTDDLTLTNSTFLRNGWREGPGGAAGSPENHGGYITGDCTGLTVTHCRFELNSSHGLQARCGGVIERCAFVDNPIGLSFGLVNGGGAIVEGGVTGAIRKNSFVGSRLLAGKPRGWAIEMSNVASAEIVDNVFANDAAPTAQAVQAAIKLDVCKLSAGHRQAAKVRKIGKLRIAGNSATWPGGPLWVGARCDDLQTQATWPGVDVAASRKAVTP